MTRPARNPDQTQRPRVRRLVAGQVLFREGDAPGPLYVVCSGSVRVFRRDLTSVDGASIELAHLGAGAVIGELAPILERPRTASIQALEPSELIEIPMNGLSALVQQQLGLQRVIGAALEERSGLSPEDIAGCAARVGLSLTSNAPADAAPTEGALPPPAYDTSVFYAKALECPSCGARFSTLVVHARKDQPAARDSDFHQTYHTPHNPYDYEFWVCPNDLYAAFSADFAELPGDQRQKVAETVERVVEEFQPSALPDFNAERTLEHRQWSLRLALALYQMRGASAQRMAAVMHRLAWCARERGDAELEQRWLGRALEQYSAAYRESELNGAKEELRIQFLCGELSSRLGKRSAAVEWFASALKHGALSEHPMWEKMLREQWSVARSLDPEPVVEERAA